jgi:hypothetical protein
MYSLNHEKSVVAILERLGLVSSSLGASRQDALAQTTHTPAQQAPKESVQEAPKEVPALVPA